VGCPDRSKNLGVAVWFNWVILMVSL
jgi:hypothetical protein